MTDTALRLLFFAFLFSTAALIFAAQSAYSVRKFIEGMTPGDTYDPFGQRANGL